MRGPDPLVAVDHLLVGDVRYCAYARVRHGRAPVVAVPLVARLTGNADGGVAVAVGDRSHLPGGVRYPVVLGDGAAVGFLCRPIVPRPGGDRRTPCRKR